MIDLESAKRSWLKRHHHIGSLFLIVSWKSEILKSSFSLGPPLCRWPLSIGSLSLSSGLSYHCQALIPAPILHVACWTLLSDDWWAFSRVHLPKKVNLTYLPASGFTITDLHFTWHFFQMKLSCYYHTIVFY